MRAAVAGGLDGIGPVVGRLTGSLGAGAGLAVGDVVGAGGRGGQRALHLARRHHAGTRGLRVEHGDGAVGDEPRDDDGQDPRAEHECAPPSGAGR